MHKPMSRNQQGKNIFSAFHAATSLVVLLILLVATELTLLQKRSVEKLHFCGVSGTCSPLREREQVAETLRTVHLLA